MRKEDDVIVPIPGRDRGKIFHLTEMPAMKAEKWAWKVFLALKGTTAEIPPELEQLGMVGIAIRGINSILAAQIKFEDLEPLLDEMLTCVSIVRDPNKPNVVTALMPDTDIEEVSTVAWLRSEVLSLHVGFSVTAALLELISRVARATEPVSSTTSTSPP